MVQITDWDGIRFTACREAYSRVAYEDPAGSGRYSYGFGFQGLPGHPVQPGDACDLSTAFQDLINHIRGNDRSMGVYLHLQIPQVYWNALNTLYYQKGNEPFYVHPDEEPRETFTSRINRGEPLWLIAPDFLKYNSGQDKVPTEGHTRRRTREMNLALNGEYGDISKFKYYENNPRASSPIMMEFPSPESLNVNLT